MHEGKARFLRRVSPEPLIGYAGINNQNGRLLAEDLRRAPDSTCGS